MSLKDFNPSQMIQNIHKTMLEKTDTLIREAKGWYDAAQRARPNTEKKEKKPKSKKRDKDVD